MQKKVINAIALLSLGFYGAYFAQGADVRVELGSQGGDGSASQPYGTVFEAVNQAPVNSTIHVGKGFYNEQGLINKALTFVADGGVARIGEGTYYKTPKQQDSGGADFVTVPAGIWERKPGLAGFYFDFLDDDHMIDEVKVVLDSDRVDVAFNDQNDDDDFHGMRPDILCLMEPLTGA